MKRKVIHMYGQPFGGSVSALCFRIPKEIDAVVGAWTEEPNDVTCRRCLRWMGM